MLPWKSGTASAGQDAKLIVEAICEFAGLQHLQPRRGQLDRQRDPVEPPADLGDRARIVVRNHEPVDRGSPTFREQLDGAITHGFIGRDAVRALGKAQRRHPIDRLSGYHQRLPA